MNRIIEIPWNDAEVLALNAYQQNPTFHPYTCGNEHEGTKILIATNDGWVCPECDYTQKWAWKPV